MLKHLQLKTLLLLACMVMGVGNVWAEDITFTPGTDTGTTSVTKGNVTATMTTMNNSSYYQIYANQSGTFSCTDGVITKIEFTCTASGTSKYGPGNASADVGSYSYSGSKGTWSGSASSITISSTAQIRMSSLVITYVSSKPAITASNVDLACDATSGEIAYTISNPTSATLTAAKTTGDWISNVAVDAENSKVTFNVTENTGAQRQGTITLSYTGADSKVVTVTQAAAVEKYTVTYSNPANGTLTIKRGDDVVASGSQVPTGTTLTIVATANDRYRVTGWQYKVGDGTWTDGVGDSYVLTGNTSFQANIVERVYHTVTWSVNGVETEEEVEENTAIDFAAPAAGIPYGYTFVGWREAALAATNTDPDDYVTAANCTADKTYYAVFAIGTTVVTAKKYTLDYSQESNLSSSTSWGSYGTEYTYTASDGGEWVIKAYKNSGMQINTEKNASIKVPTCSGNITTIEIIGNQAKAVGFSSSNYSGSKTLPTCLAEGTDATSQTLDLTGKSVNTGYIVPKSGNIVITKIVVNYKLVENNFSDYRTSIAPVAVSVTAAGYATLCTPYALDFTGLDVQAYKAAVSGDEVTFTQVNVVPAGAGLLLKGEKGAVVNVNVPVAMTTPEDLTGNVLVGVSTDDVVVDGTDGNGYYVLRNTDGHIGFYQVTNNAYPIKQNTAYLFVEGGIGAKSFIGLDEETSVNEELRMKNEELAPTYNLAGQRVDANFHGIVIIKGKKVIR